MKAYRLAVPLFMAMAMVGCSKGGGGGGENAAANTAAPAAAENAPAANTAAPAENAPAAGNAAVPSSAAENAAAAGNTAAPAENAAAPADNSGAAAGAAGADNAAAAAGGTTAANGQQVYQTTCSVCHGTGVMGAPKYGDKAAWGPRIAQGKATLYQHALNGIRQMPAKGGNPSLTDAQVKAAVDYMVAAASK